MNPVVALVLLVTLFALMFALGLGLSATELALLLLQMPLAAALPPPARDGLAKTEATAGMRRNIADTFSAWRRCCRHVHSEASTHHTDTPCGRPLWTLHEGRCTDVP